MKPKPIPLFKVLMSPDAIFEAQAVLSSGYVGQGPAVEAFERVLRQELESENDVLTFNSCTSAIDMALRLVGVGPGDYVVTTAQTCTATNSPIVTLGAHPVWADVHAGTGLIDARSVGRALDWAKERGRPAKAIMAVDWAGRACDYKTLRSFGVPVIEDAAHAFMTRTTHGAIATTGGDYVAWSFQAIKALTTCDGGALKCPVDQVERARLLRWYGLDRRSQASFRCSQNIQEVGFKFHMNDLAACIGLANMDAAIAGVAKNRANALEYNQRLRGMERIRVPDWDPDSAWWIYTLLVEDRASFVEFMTANDIEVSEVHARNDRHDAFRQASNSPVPLPGLDEFSQRQISIPVGWWLSEQDREYIADKVIAWSKLHR